MAEIKTLKDETLTKFVDGEELIVQGKCKWQFLSKLPLLTDAPALPPKAVATVLASSKINNRIR